MVRGRQLDAIPGFGVANAQDLIAEIGTDMSVFPAAYDAAEAEEARRRTLGGGRCR